MASVATALGLSRVSRSIKTAFIERENGTDRHRNARKARRTYRFSKDWRHHEAAGYLSLYSDNFCWPVRTLAIKTPGGDQQRRSPAMAVGIGRSCLVDGRMAVTAGSATFLSHEVITQDA